MSEQVKNDYFNAKLFNKIKSIKDGEFPRLFKKDAIKDGAKAAKFGIPQKEMFKFEKMKQKAANRYTKPDSEAQNESHLEKVAKLTGIDEILANRPKGRRMKIPEPPKSPESGRSNEPVNLVATEKMQEGSMNAWVDRCYDTVHAPLSRGELSQNIGELLRWDRRPIAVENVLLPNELQQKGSSETLDQDLSSDQEGGLSSEESERILRATAGAPESKKPLKELGKPTAERIVKVPEGINVVLKDFYIRDLKELESLAYNEELYAFHPEDGIIGSWRVDVKICENDPKLVNVQFEGLVTEGNEHFAMYSAGIVDLQFCPISEFRVEQVISSERSRSRSMFLHKKRRKWLFDLREGLDGTETQKTLSLKYQQMLRVITESSQIMLIRKIIMYRYPLELEEKKVSHKVPEDKRFCPCSDISGECGCAEQIYFPLKKKFKLQMRSLSICGDVCKTNYRFFAPVRVKYYCVDLEVVRVRRRMEMPGQLTQTTNYYVSTAGQLMAITFNDPYPFDTPYWLQVDPKAVLDPYRVIPPERIVPLRERYLCDPELRQFYESEVQRLIAVNEKYLTDNPRITNAIKALFQDLLNDKPHRVTAYVQNFFFEGYKFQDKCARERNKRYEVFSDKQ